jgi:hypothetical protein
MPNEPDSLCQRVELNIYDRLIRIGKDRDASILELFEAFKINHRFKKCEYGEEYTGRESHILAIAYYSTINNYKYGRKSLP